MIYLHSEATLKSTHYIYTCQGPIDHIACVLINPWIPGAHIIFNIVSTLHLIFRVSEQTALSDFFSSRLHPTNSLNRIHCGYYKYDAEPSGDHPSKYITKLYIRVTLRRYERLFAPSVMNVTLFPAEVDIYVYFFPLSFISSITFVHYNRW